MMLRVTEITMTTVHALLCMYDNTVIILIDGDNGYIVNTSIMVTNCFSNGTRY